MEEINPLKVEFEVMCFVKDWRAGRGSCTYDDAAKKFGKDEVRALISGGMLGETEYGMLNWTLKGSRAMGPEAIRRHAYKQTLREKGHAGLT